MADISIKVGNRLPKVARQFIANTFPVNLSGAVVTFDMWNASTGTQVITDGSCTILDSVQGEVEYAWTFVDATLPAGSYLATFSATFSGTRILTAPGDGMIAIEFYAETASEWSYTGNPATRPIDKVRFLMGDTDSENQLVKDAEITYLLDENNADPYMAAAAACDVLSSKFSSKADYQKQVGDLSLTTMFGEQSQKWRDQAATLRARATRAVPPTPRVFKDEKGNVFGEQIFSIGMFDNRS